MREVDVRVGEVYETSSIDSRILHVRVSSAFLTRHRTFLVSTVFTEKNPGVPEGVSLTRAASELRPIK